MPDNVRNRVKITPIGGLLSILVLCLFAAASYGDLKDGVAAYKRKDYKTALNQLRPLAEQGNAEAQYHLGLMYDNSEGVAQDYVEAAKWYRKAAQQNHPRATLALQLIYNVCQWQGRCSEQCYGSQVVHKSRPTRICQCPV